jgi:hypothetical protein
VRFSKEDLKEMCKERKEKMVGTKEQLIERLLQKEKPNILRTRIEEKKYVPKVPSCNAAILVALLLHHAPGKKPLEKTELITYAEESGVSDRTMPNGNRCDVWSRKMKVRLLFSPILKAV